MPYFYVLNGRQRHKVFPVGEKPGGDVIGQREDADVRIRDPWISWTHAKVVREGERLAIEDLGSTNGTYVNCEKVTRQPLAEDDIVFLGRTHLLFVASSRAPSAPPAGAAQTAAAAREGTVRIVVPGVHQDLPALDVSQDSALASSSGDDELPVAAAAPARVAAAHAGEAARKRARPDDAAEERTDDIRGPFRDVGRIAELDLGDDEGLPLPPDAEIAYVRPLESDDHIEIDVDELGIEPPRRGAPSSDDDAFSPIGEAVRFHSVDDLPSSSAELDPISARDAEIVRLRAALASREEEILRLRAELTKLKEQYLDL